MAAADYQGIQSLPFEEEEDIQATEEVPFPGQGMMAEDQESASVAAPGTPEIDLLPPADEFESVARPFEEGQFDPATGDFLSGDTETIYPPTVREEEVVGPDPDTSYGYSTGIQGLGIDLFDETTGEYSFAGIVGDADRAKALEDFSNWVGAGSENWTLEDWEAVEQLSASVGYGEYTADDKATMLSEFNDVMDLFNAPSDLRSNTDFSNDPRFWQLVDAMEAKYPDGIPLYRNWGDDEKASFRDLFDTGARSPDQLDHSEEDGWSFTPEGDPLGWSEVGDDGSIDASADQAYVDSIYNAMVADETPGNVLAYENARALQQLRQKLGYFGRGEIDLITGDVMDILKKGEKLSENELYIAFMSEGTAEWTRTDEDLLENLRQGVDRGAEEDKSEAEKKTDQDLFDEYFPEGHDFSGGSIYEYGDHYDAFLLRKHGNTSRYWELLAETFEEDGVTKKTGARPGSPEMFDVGGLPADAGDSPWYSPEASTHNPLEVAGEGIYGVGVLPSSEGALQSPFGDDWTLETPDLSEYFSLDEEGKEDFRNRFEASEQFFSYLRQEMEDAQITDVNQFLSSIEDSEERANLEKAYRYYGQEWDETSEAYYAAAQSAWDKFKNTTSGEELKKQLAQQLIPFASTLADFLSDSGINWTVDDVVSLLSGDAIDLGVVDDAGDDADDAGGITSMGETGGEKIGDALGPNSSNSPSGNAPDSKSAVDDADNGTTTNSNISTPNNQLNTFKPENGFDGFDAVFSPSSGATVGSFSERDTVAKKVWGTASDVARIGGLGQRGENVGTDIPQFVMDAQASGKSEIDPVSYWLGLSKSGKDLAIAEAKSAGLSTEMATYHNLEDDLYRTNGDLTEFYLPSWAAEMIYPDSGENQSKIGNEFGGEYEGMFPDYNWWQSIGAERRAGVQGLLTEDQNELIPIRRMTKKTIDGKDYAYVDTILRFSRGDEGLEPVWATEEEVDRSIGSFLGVEPVGFTDYVRWAIADSDGELSPLYLLQSAGSIRSAVGLGARTGNWRSRALPNEAEKVDLGTGPGSWSVRTGHQEGAQRWGLPTDQTNADHWLVSATDDLSATAWNYWLDNYDDYISQGGQANERKTAVPLPSSILDYELSGIPIEKDIGSIVSSQISDVSGPRYAYLYTEPAYAKVASDKNPYDHIKGTYWGTGTEYSDYGDVGHTSFGSVAFDEEDFFAQLTDPDAPQGHYGAGSGSTFWEALSLFIPSYDSYLRSYDNATSGEDTLPVFSDYVDKIRISERPEFDPDNVSLSAFRELAFQQNVVGDFEKAINSINLLPGWNGRHVADVPDYVHDNERFKINADVEDFSDLFKSPRTYRTPEEIKAAGGNAAGGIVGLGYANGGEVAEVYDEPVSPVGDIENLEALVQQDPLLQEVVDALLGSHPNPEAVIQAATEKYGQEIIAALARLIQPMGGPQSQYVPGGGGGMSDNIPATIQESSGIKSPAALSPGEFVVPADVVAHLGDGNNENGAEKLHGMMDRVRVEKTGNEEQPEMIQEEEVLPA